MEAKIARMEPEVTTASQDPLSKLTGYYNSEKQWSDTSNIKKNWWENTKTFVKDNILIPALAHVYLPYVMPAREKIEETIENIYQSYIEPEVEREKLILNTGISVVKENIYQPYIEPEVEREKLIRDIGISLVKENIYQPYIQPEIEREIKNAKQLTDIGSSWVDKNIYKPYIKPEIEREKQILNTGISWVEEKIYQPYLHPILKIVNENIYKPYIEPVVSDIDRYIYQPMVPKVSAAWEKYGEWVHGALDAVGLIPGFGEIADGINGLIYLAEGRYIEATISIIAMLPILGDLGKTGKWTVKVGQEVIDTAMKEVAEELIEKAAKEALEEASEKAIKETSKELIVDTWVRELLDIVGCNLGAGHIVKGGDSLINLIKGRYLDATISAFSMVPVYGDLAKIGKEILKNSWERVVKEAAEELQERIAREVAQVAAEKTTKQVTEELIKEITEDVATEFQGTVVEKTLKEVVEQVNEEAVQRVLKEVVEGKVTKVPTELAEGLTDEGAKELAEKLSKELGGKKVWVSAKTGLVYVSSPPAEGFLLAEQLSKTDLTKTDEVEKILKRVAELTSRGSGNHVVLGPFRPDGTFIQDALDTNGVFWDVGDELWEALNKTGIDMFKANDQFLLVQIERGIDSFDIVRENVDEVITKFNWGAPEDWSKISYTRKEILDLASMPDIPYRQVGNSWVRIDLIEQ